MHFIARFNTRQVDLYGYSTRQGQTPPANKESPGNDFIPRPKTPQESFNLQNYRRPPFDDHGTLLYLPMLCPSQQLLAKFAGMNLNQLGNSGSLLDLQRTAHNCIFADRCLYCHSVDEYNFHPLMYKSQMCQSVTTMTPCLSGVSCPFAHSQQTLRNPYKAGSQQAAIVQHKQQAVSITRTSSSSSSNSANLLGVLQPAHSQTLLFQSKSEA